MARVILLGLLVLLSLGTAKPFINAYGKPVQFYLGQPLRFADLEVTFDGGGSSEGREYRAFRVVGKNKSVLVAWFSDQTNPVSFKVAGQTYQLQVRASSNPQADGALTVWKR